MHKDKSYPGEHAAIVERDLWDQVQARLTANRNEVRDGRGSKQPSLLAGLIFDDHGNRMTPSHAVRKGKRYRYYVSRTLIAGRRADAPSGRRIPAGEIENLVSEHICRALTDQAFLLRAMDAVTTDTAVRKRLLGRAGDVVRAWPDLATAEKRRMLLIFIVRIDVRSDKVDIQLRPERLVQTVLGDVDAPPSTGEEEKHADVVVLSVLARLKRTGMETMMVIDGQRGKRHHQKPDRSLIKLLVLASDFRGRILKGPGNSIGETAEEAGVSRSYFTRILRLTYLAPDIVQAILSGSHPPDLTAARLKAASRLPLAWQHQRELLGFV